MNEKTLINKAIRQTNKILRQIQPRRDKCFVCAYYNKNKEFLSEAYCITPSDESPCLLRDMCREYVDIIQDCINKLEDHEMKLWEMIDHE